MAGEFTRRTENNQNIWTCVREGLKKNSPFHQFRVPPPNQQNPVDMNALLQFQMLQAEQQKQMMILMQQQNQEMMRAQQEQSKEMIKAQQNQNTANTK